MFQFKQYTEEFEKEWDKFIEEQSINGTFLQSRRFFNYHIPGKFKDVSLVIYNEKSNIVALCPACEVEQDGKKIFYSHKGSTFGGIIIDKKHYRAQYIIELVNELKSYLNTQGYDEVYLKMTSDIFSQVESDLFQYAFQYHGFKEAKELSTYIDYATYGDFVFSNFSQRKRRSVRNCQKQGMVTRPLNSDNEIEVFYEILCDNLQKYNTKPVHTLEELLEFKNKRFTKECEFFGTYLGDEMVAGCMLFYFHKTKCAHTQYLAAKQAYNKLSPMSFVYYSMILEMKKRGYQYLSWGIATENMGEVLNMGLITNKEEFGSSYCNNLTYYLAF